MKKTISITDEEVIYRLDSMKNQSGYIQNLILKDIWGELGKNNYQSSVLVAIGMIQKMLNDMAEQIEKGENGHM